MEQEAGQHRFVMPDRCDVLTKCACSFPLWPAENWRAWEIAAERHLRQIPWDSVTVRDCGRHGETLHTVRWRYLARLERFTQRTRCVTCARGKRGG